MGDSEIRAARFARRAALRMLVAGVLVFAAVGCYGTDGARSLTGDRGSGQRPASSQNARGTSGRSPANATVPSIASSSTSANRAATSYYVATSGADSNPGTRAAPWRTIAHAAQMVRPGDVVHVEPGSYHENVSIRRSETAVSRIAFVSDTKWGAKVTGMKSTPTIDIRANYVDLIGFEVTNPHGFVGIQVTGNGGIGSYDRVIANHVHDIAGACILKLCRPGMKSGGGAGIVVSDNLNHDDDVIGNLVHDIGDPLNPQNADIDHGIYVELGGDLSFPSAGSYSAKVENNIIYNIEGDGITSWHCTSNMIVTNNTIVGAGVQGILLSASYQDCKKGQRGKPNASSVVANNILVGNGWHSVCSPEVIRRHLCVRKDVGGGCGLRAYHAVHARLMNNLSYDNRCNKVVSGRLGVEPDVAASSTISGNLVGDPMFVDPQRYDFHLRRGSPAVDHGTSFDAPNTDFDGSARPQGAGYDIGAYEYR